jgi:hypothetical protein
MPPALRLPTHPKCCVAASDRALRHVNAWASPTGAMAALETRLLASWQSRLSPLKPLVKHYTEPGWRFQPCVMVAGRKTWHNLPARWPPHGHVCAVLLLTVPVAIGCCQIVNISHSFNLQLPVDTTSVAAASCHSGEAIFVVNQSVSC